MAEVTLTIGAAAACRDSYPGELTGLVVEPKARIVTHLVVEPEGSHGLARLVPFDHADVAADPIALSYTEAEFKDLSPAEQTLAEFVPGYEVPVQLLPAGQGWRPAEGPVADGETIAAQIREMETVPLVPDAEVEESGDDDVHATDGRVGRFHGLGVDAGNGAVLHVLLKRHSWGHEELAVVPIGSVSGFEAGVQLSITKQEVKNLF
jgi:hypothetical protein